MGTGPEAGEMADDVVAPELGGLCAAEVQERRERGETNAYAGPRTKSVAQIVRGHTFTLFNGVNLVLACMVALTGSWRNLSFMCVVLCNLAIGIFQEIRSKRTIDRLSILAERPVTVRREGTDVEAAHGEVVLDDLVVLTRGCQVPADAEVAWGVAGVNESLLTGESEPVTKVVGDELMSGSFLDSGCVVARVTRVGASSYAARINAEAKYVKVAKSEIMLTLSAIIRLATWLLGPIGVALFFRTMQDGSTMTQAILTTVAALVGMIPQGLVLLTSTVLAISTARLARKSVLIQQFYCIEMLALEPNHERVHGNFLVNVLARSAPASLAIVLAVGAQTALGGVLGLEHGQTSTACVLLTALVGACLVLRISRPLNALRTCLLAVVVAIVAIGCTLFADFFEIEPITPIMWACVCGVGAVALVAFNVLYNLGVSLANDGTGWLDRFVAEREAGGEGLNPHEPDTRI